MGDSSSSSLGSAPISANATSKATAASFMKKTHLDLPRTASSIVGNDKNNDSSKINGDLASSLVIGGEDHDDRFNYALLLALYTLQGIPMGLSASIPFLIQQKVQMLAASAGHHAASAAASAAGAASQAAHVLTHLF